MEWIEFIIEKPKVSDYYFVKGKHDTKACLYYYADSETWEIGYLAHNYFADGEIFWLKEV